MKTKIILLPILVLALSSCTFIPIDSTSGESQNGQTGGITSEDSMEPTSGDITTSIPTSETETSTSTGPVDPNLVMYNGFTYPLDAQTQATPSYVEFWHPDTEVIITISADSSILNLMDQHGLEGQIYQDLYWPVDVVIAVNGVEHSLEEVGMRRKGNTSRGYSFMDNGTVSDAFSFKLSFNETWDDPIYQQFGLQKSWLKTDPDYIARDDRQFLADSNGKNGLDKLDIKMYKTNDQSMINQAFAFSLFQKGGLIAPNSTLGKINFYSGTNYADFGVVAINETIDKDLLKRYFSKANAAGDLYKVGWGPDGNNNWNKGNLRYEEYLNHNAIIGEEDKMNAYTPRYDAKEFDKYADVNKTILNSHDVAHANLINLMRVLRDYEGQTPTQYQAALEAVVDVDSFLNFAALSYLTGNQDDMRNNGNNYYIYFNPGQNNKAYFIPYDYDWALGVGFDEDGGLTMAAISPFHSKLQGNGRNWQDNRLFLYTIIDSMSGFNIQTNNNWQASYLNKLQGYIEGDYYTINTFNDLYNRYRLTYENSTNILSLHTEEVYNNFGGTDIFAQYVNQVEQSIIAESTND
ncbi:MAG: CotH kinase family protein [Bacilli bacterium]